MSAEEFHDTSHGHRSAEEHHAGHDTVEQTQQQEVPASMVPQDIDGFDEVISPEVVEWAIAVDGESKGEADTAADGEGEQGETPQDAPDEAEAEVETEAQDEQEQPQEPKQAPQTDPLEAFYSQYESYFANKTAAEFIQETHEYTRLLAEADAPHAEIETYLQAGATLEGVFPAIEGDNGPSGEPYTDEQKQGARALMNILTESLLHVETHQDAQDFWKQLATEALSPTDIDLHASELFATPSDQLLDKTVDVARQASQGFLDHTPRQQYQLVLDLFNERKSHVDQTALHAQQALKALEDKFNGHGDDSRQNDQQNQG